MARVRIPADDRTITDESGIRTFLGERGIDYERWTATTPLDGDATADDILRAYAGKIDELKARGRYVTADVIDITPSTPGLEAMLKKFNVEHWHDEDEVRFIVEGRGLFHVHPAGGAVFSIEVESGDLIRVPRGTLHWFDLCADRRIRAIRLFQDPAGWTPHYTASGVDEGFQPLCFGPGYVDAAPTAGT